MNTRFSIITPLYNKEKYILETIESVLKQTYTNFEFIIINDGSTDNSLNLINKIKDNRIHIHTINNKGVSHARNFGINHSNGEYICFLDADDLWDKRYLEILSNVISKEKNVDFLFSKYIIFNNNKKRLARKKYPAELKYKEYFDIDFLKLCIKNKGCIALTSAICIKSSLLKKTTTPFNEKYSLGEDIDCWIRTACIAKRIIHINKYLMYYRNEDNNSLCHKKDQIFNKTYPYWLWYNISSDHFLKKFTTRMIYTFSRDMYKSKDFTKTIFLLKKIRGYYLLPKRSLLYILSFVKQYLIY